ncbi:MAG TPA: methyltransferase domain-containing protein [Candidatus Binatia bacterium]|nr:methyltransferase domain-containing protein [Candidatus Binatia bacterium]
MSSRYQRSVASAWDPAQYNRFAAERQQPFWDLRSLLEPVAAPLVADLGCGDGRLTAALHRDLAARRTDGIDLSETMLAAASARAEPNLRFSHGDIGAWSGSGYDVVFSNAALQWAPDHRAVLERWRGSLADGGQLAVQMPANADHPSHTVLVELAADWIGPAAPPDPVATNVLRPEEYSGLLDQLGFDRQVVRLQVYPHRLASAQEVVEWMRGTSLNRFKASMGSQEYSRFVEEYRRRLIHALDDEQPYLYTFKRILLWGRLGAGADLLGARLSPA